MVSQVCVCWGATLLFCGITNAADVHDERSVGSIRGEIVITDKNLHGHKSEDSSVIIGKAGGLANVFVYLISAVDTNAFKSTANDNKEVKLDLQNAVLIPRLSLIQAPRKVMISNRGNAPERLVFSMLNNATARHEDYLLPASSYTFMISDNEERPMCVCRSQRGTKSWILVRTNPFMVCTDESGQFAIEHLPTGDHEFYAWHEKGGLLLKDKFAKGRIRTTVSSGKVTDLGRLILDPESLGITSNDASKK